MGRADQQHLDWLARSAGRADYRPLSWADVEAIQAAGELVSIRAGTHLFSEGEPATAAYVIEQGNVEISRGIGAKRRVLARVGPGSVLGDVAMFRDTKHKADARALQKVAAYRFARSRLLSELGAQPGIFLGWLVAAMSRFEHSQRRIFDLMHKTVLAQVADLLVEEGERQPDVNLSQSTIAVLLGVSRQSVNEALAILRERDVVETGYRKIRILDLPRLEEIAER